MNLNKGDIIKDGEHYYSIFCIMFSVIYVQRVSEPGTKTCYKLEDILQHFKKIEIMGDKL